MDVIDQANARAERDLELALQAARSQSEAHASVALTECSNGCGEMPLPGSHYCSPECRDDHDYRLRILRKQGLAK